MRRFLSLSDAWPDIFPVQWQFLVQRATAEFDECRIPIDHMREGVDGGAGLDVAVPGGKRAGTGAAFIQSGFSTAQRAVAGDPPGRGPPLSLENMNECFCVSRFRR